MSHRLDGYLPPRTANGVHGSHSTMYAQSALGTNANGGSVILVAGSGTLNDGSVWLITGPTGSISVVSPLVTIDGYQFNPVIFQADQPLDGFDGNTLTIAAQTSTAPSASGGDLILRGGDGYTGDGYIRHGQVRLFSGPIEVSKAIHNKFEFLTGQRLNLTDVDSTPFDVMDSHHILMVDTGTLAITVNLPDTPERGDVYQVKDRSGNAAANNITVSGNGRNIEASGSSTISTNYGRVTVVYNDTDDIWNIL